MHTKRPVVSIRCCLLAITMATTGCLVAAAAAEEDAYVWSAAVQQQVQLAGDNAAEIMQALTAGPADQRASMEFLIEHMPERDLKTLSAEFLLENVRLAHKAREESAWKISDELFLNDVLPYANVDEVRERWRPEMFARAKRLTADCKTPGEAAQRLNEKIFADVKVKYSTARKKANQSPSESIEQGLASCTGLSILLVDACRSVNVPARVAGIPDWPNKDGNHTWVEVWDNGQWHFTGAAEYNPDGLNRTWFQGDAALADKHSKMHSIYAVSYGKTDTRLPMVWSPDFQPVYAINVTDRYTPSKPVVEKDQIRVMVRVVDQENGHRVAVPVTIHRADDPAEKFNGTSRDESADTNDLLTFVLKRGQKYVLCCEGTGEEIEIETDDKSQQNVEIKVPRSNDSACEPLAIEQAAAEAQRMLDAYLDGLRKSRAAEWEAKLIELGELKMKFDYRVFGERPADGHSLFISMHGGGGAPAEVNEQQWQNQIGLYEPKEGIYLAPRAPTDTWNLWHQGHIDAFFARIIEDAIAIEGIDPNRVYIMGYSAGGDGVYQLAGRMADQLAAAAMMAGHPNDASPLGLRNIGFTLHMGGQDDAYDRNKVAAEWKQKLAALRADDPTGYAHEVLIHPECGHWMEGKDAVSLDWMAKFTRNPLPNKIVWYQSSVTHDRFYWLAVADEDRQPGAKMVVTRTGNEFTIEETKGVSKVIIRLNERMVDFAQPIVVRQGDHQQAFSSVQPNRQVIERTIAGRGDVDAVFIAEIEVPVR